MQDGIFGKINKGHEKNNFYMLLFFCFNNEL